MYPLTIAQQNFLKREKIIEDSSINNIAGLLKLGTKFNYEQINKAVNQLIFNHDSYRIQVTFKSGNAKQYIKAFEEIAYPYLDFYQDQLNFDTWINKKANTNIFDYNDKLYRFYILKLPDGQLGLLAIQNHLIGDGWSMPLSINYFITYLTNQDTTEIPKLSFVNAIEDEVKYLQSKKLEKDEIYWREKLNRQKQQISDKPHQLEHVNGQRRTIKLSTVITEKINEFCLKNEISVSNLFTSIMFALIDKKAVTKINNIGISIHNRANKNEKFTTGNYAKSLPIIIESEQDLLLNEYIQKVKRESFNILKHRKYPIDDLLSELNMGNNIIDCLISFQTASYSSEFIENGFSEKKLEVDAIGGPLEIQIFNKNSESGYLLHYDYQTEVLSAYEIEQLHENILKMLNELVIDSERKLEENNIL